MSVNIPQFVINDIKLRNEMNHKEPILKKLEKNLKIKATKLLVDAIRFSGFAIIALMVFKNLKG